MRIFAHRGRLRWQKVVIHADGVRCVQLALMSAGIWWRASRGMHAAAAAAAAFVQNKAI
jgi:hypothetical protein